jgi:hypothetical protein
MSEFLSNTGVRNPFAIALGFVKGSALLSFSGSILVLQIPWSFVPSVRKYRIQRVV